VKYVFLTNYTIGYSRYYKENDGMLWLDVGPYCAALEYAMDITAELVGKPSKSFFLGALQKIGVAPEDVSSYKKVKNCNPVSFLIHY
jgi:ribonucleotide monophosphatase NagD (HAD superfamily)